ncbi:HXXEE domain-containing protein [Nocardia paucivorans]|uniref:HXXEE domain-containing protein n=1 Tax=Nocardia paucivorans TaxID=114259 RepID=UPI0012F90CB2
MTTEKFAVSHIPLILIVLLRSWRASPPDAHTGRMVMTVAFQWQFAVNAIFHLGTAAWFGDYSPDMVTAATVALPVTVWGFARVRRKRLLTGTQQVAAIGVLFLE